MRRLIAWLCTVALVVSMGSTAFAAESTTAAVLRLQSSTGTVTVTNQTGRTLTTQDELRLQNGYTISTGAASYAYISLDDTKAVKLDGLTTCTVVKQGTKLELLLESGQLFFNVTAPLTADETLNIRTSTMATGIRGTSGSASSDGVFESTIRLFTGSATVSTVNSTGVLSGQAALTQGVSTTQIVGGEEATSGRNLSTGLTELIVTSIPAGEYSAFELESILEQDGLLDEILANGNTAITEELFENLGTLVAAEEGTQLALEESTLALYESQTDSDTTTQTTVDTTSTASTGSTTSSSGSSSSGSTTTTTTASVSTEEELLTALAAGTTTITLTGNVTLTEGQNVPEDTTLVISDGATLTLEDDLTIYGTVTVESGGTLVNSDALWVFSTNSLDVEYGGTVQNVALDADSKPYIFVGSTGVPGAMTVDGYVTGGSISVAGASTLTLRNNGEISETEIWTTASGAQFNMTGGTLGSTSTSAFSIAHINAGTFNLSGGTVSNMGTRAGVGVSGGTFNMSGGTVSAVDDSAVDLNSGYFNLTGGLVSVESGKIAISIASDATLYVPDLDTDATSDTVPTIRALYGTVTTTVSDLITMFEGDTAEVYVSEGNDGYHYLLTYKNGNTASGGDDDSDGDSTDDAYYATAYPDSRISEASVIYDVANYTMTVDVDTEITDSTVSATTYEVFGIVNDWAPTVTTDSDAVLYGHAGTVAQPIMCGETVFYFTVKPGESVSYSFDKYYEYDEYNVQLLLRTLGGTDLSSTPTVVSVTHTGDDAWENRMWSQGVYYDEPDDATDTINTLYLYTYSEVNTDTIPTDFTNFTDFAFVDNDGDSVSGSVTGIECKTVNTYYSQLKLTVNGLRDTGAYLVYNGTTIADADGEVLYCYEQLTAPTYTTTGQASYDGTYVHVSLSDGYVLNEDSTGNFTFAVTSNSNTTLTINEANTIDDNYVGGMEVYLEMSTGSELKQNVEYTITITPPSGATTLTGGTITAPTNIVTQNTASETTDVGATYNATTQELSVSFPNSDGFRDEYFSCAWYVLITDADEISTAYYLRGMVDGWDSTSLTWDASQFPFDPSVLETALEGDTYTVTLTYDPTAYDDTTTENSYAGYYTYSFRSGMPMAAFDPVTVTLDTTA